MLGTSVGQVDFTTDKAYPAAIVAIVGGVVLLIAFYLWARPNGYYSSGAADVVARVTSGAQTDFVGSSAYLWWGVWSLIIRARARLDLRRVGAAHPAPR